MTAANLQKALEANVRMHSTPYKSEIRRMITMFCGMGSITKYKPLTAKALVQFFGSKRVLDPCAGWGGRMLGTLAAATDTVYVACEPDQKTHAALTEIVSHIGQEARTTLIHAPVESAWQTLAAMEPFDMILTSPPYFNLELYCEGEQSVQTFPEWSVWVREWLTPLIQGCLVRLKPTGVSCWSVKNFRSDKAYPLADVVKEIHERAGWRLVKTMGLKSSGRPGSKRIQDGKEAREAEEETFCFRR
jgi:predicted RNA methylase